MDVNEVLFSFLGIEWTWASIGTALIAAIPAFAALYKIWDRWVTRERRRLDMLHEYLDKEEKDITGKRRTILSGIQSAINSYLPEKKFDVGAELDQAIELLDSGLIDRARGRLSELDKKLNANASILERRASDLRKHRSSVQIFLASIAEGDSDPNIGLNHIANALTHNHRDQDALKLEGLLLLKKGDLDQAEASFDKLRRCSNGDENAAYRADAHLGLANVSIARGVAHYGSAVNSLRTALDNIGDVPPSARDPISEAYIFQQLGIAHNNPAFADFDQSAALGYFRDAQRILGEIPKRRGLARERYHEVYKAIMDLDLH